MDFAIYFCTQDLSCQCDYSFRNIDETTMASPIQNMSKLETRGFEVGGSRMVWREGKAYESGREIVK